MKTSKAVSANRFALEEVTMFPARNKNRQRTLMFGDLIASVFTACSHRKARALVRFAVNARVIVFLGRWRFVIS
jgi:hypothetical protein